MIVVSDTSPINALIQIGEISLLERLFHKVIIPPSVAKELAVTHTVLEPFIEVHELTTGEGLDALLQKLDAGEAEAILLAKEQNADYILMDETLGRAIALESRLPVLGLLGVLLMAKRQEFIPLLAPLLSDLKAKAGFYVSQDLINYVLREAGERTGNS